MTAVTRSTPSAWADLNALVAEETLRIGARRARPEPAPQGPDDRLLSQIAALLAGHPDPAGLLSRLQQRYQPPPAPPEDDAE